LSFWVDRTIERHIDDEERLGRSPMGGHTHAMIYYMKAQILEAGLVTRPGHMGYGYRFDYIVEILHEALRHEPGNSLVDAKSKQWEVEVGYSNTWRALVDDFDGMYKRGWF